MSATVLPSHPTTISSPSLSKEKLTCPPSSTCKTHSPSPTPQIDTLLADPKNREYILTLSEALADIADSEGEHCTKCAIDTVAQTFTLMLKDAKKAKKSGKWTKEERKALEKEAKVLGKSVKRDAEKTWREEN